MLFNSLDFFIFFPLVVLAYFLLPYKHRWILLLGASYYFYMAWKAEYIILIIISTLVDFFVSNKMGKLERKKDRKPWLMVSIFANLGILFAFKYFNFFIDNLEVLFGTLGFYFSKPVMSLLLPMGISFYTFQTLSYSIDVYNGKIKPEPHLGHFALFVTYFPQLVAGPIERAENLLPELKGENDFVYERVIPGLKQMLWGFFKKLVIADNLAIIVDTIYNQPTDFQAITLIFGTFLFSFQLYCDFSGYSHIAIGASRILGIKLMDNFNLPFSASSMTELWQKWHISLSTWVNDYLFGPIVKTKPTWGRYGILYGLLITFLILGLWHGASWTFVMFGVLHGSVVSFEYFTKKYRKNWSKKIGKANFNWISWFVTMVLWLIGCVFFRSNTLSDAVYILSNIFGGGFDIADFTKFILKIGSGVLIIKMLLVLFFILADPFLDRFLKGTKILIGPPSYLLYSSVLVLIIVFGYFGDVNFIYFQF